MKRNLIIAQTQATVTTSQKILIGSIGMMPSMEPISASSSNPRMITQGDNLGFIDDYSIALR